MKENPQANRLHCVSRRGFLEKGAAALGGLAFPFIIPAAALGRGGAVAPSNRINIGIIGCGGQGQANLRAFLLQKDVQCIAVCDADRKHALEGKAMVDARYKSEDCRVDNDFRELLERESAKLDAVCISTPDHWHAMIAIAAARAGLDVYGEPPFSHNLRDGRAMVETMERYGRVWQTGSWQRSDSAFRKAAELVRNGRLGKIERVEIGMPVGGANRLSLPVPIPENLDWDLWLGPAPWSPHRRGIVHFHWRWIRDFGGGQLMDWIGHHADIALWGLERDATGPVEVEAAGEFPAEGWHPAPSKFRVVATYDDGFSMILSDSHRQRKRMGIRWIGEEGWIHVDRGSRLEASNLDLLKEPLGVGATVLERGTSHHANFIDCVKSRRPTIAPAESAHRAASVGHLGLIAMLTGRKIHWNPVTETIKNDPAASALLGRAHRQPWTL